MSDVRVKKGQCLSEVIKDSEGRETAGSSTGKEKWRMVRRRGIGMGKRGKASPCWKGWY